MQIFVYSKYLANYFLRVVKYEGNYYRVWLWRNGMCCAATDTGYHRLCGTYIYLMTSASIVTPEQAQSEGLYQVLGIRS